MVGGNNDVTELYNFEDETWSFGGDYPTAVRYHSVSFFDGHFYSVGGMRHADNAYLPTVAKYVDGRWETLTNGLNFGRGLLKTLVINDSLWVIGGVGDKLPDGQSGFNIPLEVCEFTDEGVDCKDKGNTYSGYATTFVVDENFCTAQN